jgi:osmotically-inducible protein OsmY
MIHLTERAEFRPTPESLKALQDFALQSRVMAALATDFRTQDAELHVTADNGNVVVKGSTRWQEIVNAVPAVVRPVDGVKTVTCEITGATPPPSLTWY